MEGMLKKFPPFKLPLLHLNPFPTRKATKLRRIHTLNATDPIRKSPFVHHPQRVFKHISPFAQVIDEEVRSSVASAFVVAQAALVLVLAQHVHRFEAGGAHVFQVDVFHIAVGAQFYPYDQFVAGAQRLGGGDLA